jgi:pimeloyl-ACP methyl ester carboxylesterase
MGAQVVTELALARLDLARALVLLGPVTDSRARLAARQGIRSFRDGLHEPGSTY